MAFKAVLFDLWETLISDAPERSQPRRERRTDGVLKALSAHGYVVERETVSAALDTASRALTALHDQGQDISAAGRAHLFLDTLDTATGRPAPRAAAAGVLQVVVAMPLDMAPRLAPHAHAAVAGVCRLGLSTALVSNSGFTTGASMRKVLDHYGLTEHFDVMVFSDEQEIAKPDPRIFDIALQELALPSEECVFVGDNPLHDISGALAAGLYTVQLGTKSRDGVRPHARIDSLDELTAVLLGQHTHAP